MIRILHFISSIQVVDFFRGLAEHHDRSAFELHVCTLDGPGPLQAALAPLGVRGYALGSGGRLRYPLAVLRLARLLRRERIDVIHTHLFDPSAVGMLAGLLARTPGRVMTRWYSDLHEVLGRPVHAWIDGRVACLAHVVIAISEYTRDVLVRDEGLPAARVRVIHPAFESPANLAEHPRDGHGEMAGCQLGIAARLHPVKDHRSLLLAFRRVLDACPQARLHVVGAGWLEPELRALAAELGIDKAIEFAGFQRDMAQVYRKLDILVHPVIEEAFGFVVVEAMARGIPVVCTPRGIAREIIVDGVNGRLVPVGDPPALADALIGLIESPDLRARLGAAGRESVRGRFSYEATARAYEAVYREVRGR
ncbi:MAG: glycosyltransferase family 4 protein [Candidatus Rokubacteria bacterium]|nr:glycosyltransferase family 4 protein [Candidatus Rokubacteria bacterium]